MQSLGLMWTRNTWMFCQAPIPPYKQVVFVDDSLLLVTMYFKQWPLCRLGKAMFITCLLCYIYVIGFLYTRLEPAQLSPPGLFGNRRSQQGKYDIHTDKSPTFVQILPGMFGYSAYLDTRYERPIIRIIAAVNERAPKKGLCHFWPPSSLSRLKKNFGENLGSLSNLQRHRRLAFFTDVAERNLSSPIEFFETCEGHGLRVVAFYLSCVVPDEVRHNVSSVVISKTVLWSSTDQLAELPVSHIRLHQEKSPPDRTHTNFVSSPLRIGVCVPPLFGSVKPDTLVEFIEATRILGAMHFIFYDYEISESAAKVLQFYAHLGVVTVLPWRLPFVSDSIWYYGQSVSIGDCLFRTMGQFDWVMFNDIDEFMVPRSNFAPTGTITEFFAAFEKLDKTSLANVASIGFPSAVFETPLTLVTNLKTETFVSMTSVKRTGTISEVLTKQIVKPERVFELGIHHLSVASREHFTGELVSRDIGLLHHYRPCKEGFQIECEQFVVDETFTRHLETLKNRVKKAAFQLENL